jgi:enoyl-CoA hydratase
MADAEWVALRLSDDGRVATLTIQEPRLNVLSTPVLQAFLRRALELQRLPGLRLAVVTGGGERAFIGGADLDEMAEFTPETALVFIDRVHQVCHALRALPVPCIARVRGYCLGAGMEVAAACDLRIGSADSRYGMPEVQVGLPSVVEARLLPTLIGWGRTRELLYTGALIDARQAERIGFLEKVAPAAELDAAMQPWIEAILAAEPGAVRAQKRLIEGWLEGGVAAGVRASMDAFSQIFHSDAPTQRLREARERLRRR